MINWVCNYCTQINSESHNFLCAYCNNLNNDRIYEERHLNIPSCYNRVSTGQWNCSYCTFINKSTTTHCEMCLNQLERLIPLKNINKASRIVRVQSIDETIIPDDLDKDLIKAKKIRNIVLSKLVNHNKFVDEEFRPCYSSIGQIKRDDELVNGVETSFSRAQHSLNSEVQWLRPENLRGDEYSNSELPWAVTRNPSSDDIVQGKLGNCWLLTGLALIADKPSLLDRILITKEVDARGFYQVRLCKDGMWTVVTIDDLFPANRFGQMIYSKANRKQLWVSLIEKAAAKLYGSYECLTLGYCADGLSTLTGSPCETLKLSGLMDVIETPPVETISGSIDEGHYDEDWEEKYTPDTVWAMLLSAKDANFFTCVSCGSDNENPSFLSELSQLGLRNLHAYAILDIVNMPNLGLRLLRLKNPWARLTWKGEWSDDHESWNTLSDSIREQIQPRGVTGESCGVFWISWKDVLRYFFALDICRYRTNWHEIRMQTHLPYPIWIDWQTQELCMNVELAATSAIPETNNFIRSPSPILEIEESNTCAVLTVLESTQLQIALWQSASRKNKPIDILIVICSDYKSPIGHIVASSNRQTSSYVTCDAFLDAGKYTIFYISLYYWQCTTGLESTRELLKSHNDNLNGSLFDCTLSVHSSKPILLQRATLTPEMIPRVIADLAMYKGRLQLFGNAKIYTLMKGYSGIIMLVINPVGNTDIRCTSDSTGSVNLKNSRGKNFTKSEDILAPGCCQIITVLTQDDAYSTYSIQHRYTASIFPLKGLSDYPELQGSPSVGHWPPIQLILHQPMRLC